MPANLKFPWLLFLIILFLLVVDLYLSFTNPISAVGQKLGLERQFIKLALSISFTGPIFASFFLGSWSYLLLIKKPEFHLVAKSILTLTLVLLTGVVLGVIRSHFYSSDVYGMYKIFTITINYTYSFGYLLGFGLLFYSTLKILPIARNWNILVSFLIALLIGTLYSIILLTSPDKFWAANPDIKPSHFLSDRLLVMTVIFPTVLGWFFAIWSAFRLVNILSAFTGSQVRQEGYKNILNGVLFIVFSVIMLQAIASIGTTRFLLGGLILILVLLYTFVGMLTVGNIFVLKGARKLVRESS